MYLLIVNCISLHSLLHINHKIIVYKLSLILDMFCAKELNCNIYFHKIKQRRDSNIKFTLFSIRIQR